MLRTFTALAAACALAGAARPCAADGGFGPSGAEFEIASAANQIRIATDAGERVFALWGEGTLVWARLYDDFGRPLGPPMVVPKPWYAFGYVHDTRVAAGPGTFVVTFLMDSLYAGSGYVLGYAVYTRDGNLIYHGPVALTDYIENALAVSTTGEFLVAWPVKGEEIIELHARLFGADGERMGGSFKLATAGGHVQDPVLTRDRENGYLARWSESSGEDRVRHYARRFDASGIPAGDLVPLGGPAAVCTDAVGGFATAWTTLGPGAREVWMQRYGPDDLPLGEAQRVDGEAPASAWPAQIACADDGALVVAWESLRADGFNVFARRYNAGGIPGSPVFRINEPTAGDQCFPAISGNGRGDFTIAWVDVQGSFRPHARNFHLDWAHHVKGDFDGDGHADLVLRRIDDGRVRVWTLREGVRTQNFLVWPPTPDWAWHLGGVDDFNADGHADLVFRHQVTGQVDIWLMGGESGGECIGHAAFTGVANLPPEWIVAATGDFDGDGRPDVLWRNRNTGKLRVWLLAGTQWRATRVPTPDHAEDANWVPVAAGDFNGDGWGDLLWYNPDSGRVVQWLLDATLTRMLGRFTTPMTAGEPTWDVAALADYGFGRLGQAGTLDILWHDDATGRLQVWFMDNGGVYSFGAYTTPAAPADPLAWAAVGPR